MNCPKCSGEVRARDTIHTAENEIYRKRKCISCGHVFYTLEFEVENNDSFQAEWRRILRTKKNAWKKKRRKIYTLYLRENGEVVASGTAEECAKQMGIPESAFRMIISRTNRGIIKRYEAEIRDYTEEGASA